MDIDNKEELREGRTIVVALKMDCLSSRDFYLRMQKVIVVDGTSVKNKKYINKANLKFEMRGMCACTMRARRCK